MEATTTTVGGGRSSSGGGSGAGHPDPAVLEAIEQRGNVVVFLDVALGDGGDGGGDNDDPSSSMIELGRIKLELFVKDVRVVDRVVVRRLVATGCA